MTDHTPTTEGVRDGWAYGNQEVDYDGNPVITLDEACAQFDRWLTAHDRKIAAEALREAADALTVRTVDPAYEGQQNDGEFGSGFYQSVRSCRRALRDRADRIEQGGES